MTRASDTARTLSGGAVFNEGSADVDLRVESNGNANMLFVDGGNDSVIIGHNDGTNGTFLSQAAFQVVGTDATGAHIGLSRSSDNAFPCTLSFTKSRGAVGTDTVVQDDDEIGQILFAAGDGTDLSSQGANIKVALDGTPGANDVPCRMTFGTTADGASSATERLRITSAGDLLIGKTTTALGTAGHRISPSVATFVRDGGGALIVNRLTNGGNLAEFYQASSHAGTIGATSTKLHIASVGNSGIRFRDDLNCITPCNADGSNSDNDQNLGQAGVRYGTIFATEDSINTSDRTEKQDIEELTDAEKRVAVVAKGLMRKYRWIDAVAKKGDKARIHFGIIAQDLQDAFTAESLDASRYSMFCSDTWWEKEISVDAVEAKDAVYKEVIDEDGGKTTELVSAEVEAKDAYTYIDDKQEATTGYTEKTRLGVRYSELLAFIISAI